MARLRRKISGCARTFEGTQRFARITGYASTSLKQAKDLPGNTVKAIAGRPWIPQPRISQS